MSTVLNGLRTGTVEPPPKVSAHWLRRTSFGVRLGIVVATGVVFRLVYLFAQRDLAPSTDGFLYRILAVDGIAEGRGFVNPFGGSPTAFHPPAWPLILALPARVGLDSQLEAQFVALAIGTVTVVLIAFAGRAIAGSRVGLIAAALAVVYPNIWMWERQLASETLALPLVAAAILLAYRFHANPRLVTLVALAVVCGALVLTRAEQVLVVVGILLPLVIACRDRLSPRRVVSWAAIATLTFGLVLTPWVAYNWTRFDHPVLLTTSLGSNIRMGNNDFTYHGSWLGSIDFSQWAFGKAATGDESQADADDRDLGLTYMRDNLDRVPIVVAARQGRTWSVFNVGQGMRLDKSWGADPLWVYQWGTVMYWLLVIAAVGGVVALRRRKTLLFPLLTPFAIVVLATAITYGEPRYRASAEVPLVLLAAAGIDAILRRRAARARDYERASSSGP